MENSQSSAEPELDAGRIEAEMAALSSEAGSDDLDALTGQTGELDAARKAGEAEYNALLCGLLGPMFLIIAPGWNVQQSEVEMLAGAYSALLQKYFPDGPGNFGPELGAVAITIAVVGPRLRLARKPKTEEKPAAAQPAKAVSAEPSKPGRADGQIDAQVMASAVGAIDD